MLYKIEQKRRGKTTVLKPSYKTLSGAKHFVKRCLSADRKQIKTINGEAVGTINSILGKTTYRVVEK